MKPAMGTLPITGIFRHGMFNLLLSVLIFGSALCPAQSWGVSADYLSLFKITVAGDYQSLRIEAYGRAEFVRFDRDYQVLAHTKGVISSKSDLDPFGLLTKIGFFGMADQYPAPPRTSPEGVEISREDVWFWVEGVYLKRKKTLLAHEVTCPKPLCSSYLPNLFQAAEKLPADTGKGTYILAIDFRVHPQLRREKGIPEIDLDRNKSEQFDFLKNTLARPGTPVLLPETARAKIETLVSPDRHLIRCLSGGREFVLFVLTKTQ